jgi:hypothetical protein
VAVELARQHALELDLVERLADGDDLAGRLLRRGFVARFFGEVEQDFGVRQRAELRVVAADDLLEVLLVAEDGLRLLLVVPERRFGRDRIELLDLQTLRIDVKATSGAPPPCR